MIFKGGQAVSNTVFLIRLCPSRRRLRDRWERRRTSEISCVLCALFNFLLTPRACARLAWHTTSLLVPWTERRAARAGCVTLSRVRHSAREQVVGRQLGQLSTLSGFLDSRLLSTSCLPQSPVLSLPQTDGTQKAGGERSGRAHGRARAHKLE